MSVVKPRAVFFDWDGTAVYSRKAPADAALSAMRPLLAQGVKLVIVSGTTIENIAGGQLEKWFTPEELKNLYLGLGRGAYNYAFDDEGSRMSLPTGCRTGKAFWQSTASVSISIRSF